nr:hypothetical protein BaRGS_002020 [Batillaria attramentaria]
MIGLLLRAGCCTEKVQGHIYYRDHYANSFFFALWSGNCLESMKLFLDCGYRVNSLKVLFRDVPPDSIFSFLEEVNLFYKL